MLIMQSSLAFSAWIPNNKVSPGSKELEPDTVRCVPVQSTTAALTAVLLTVLVISNAPVTCAVLAKVVAF